MKKSLKKGKTAVEVINTKSILKKSLQHSSSNERSNKSSKKEVKKVKISNEEDEPIVINLKTKKDVRNTPALIIKELTSYRSVK